MRLHFVFRHIDFTPTRSAVKSPVVPAQAQALNESDATVSESEARDDGDDYREDPPNGLATDKAKGAPETTAQT